MTAQPETLSYAQPTDAADVAVMPRAWLWRATTLWAATLLAEKLFVGWVVVSMTRMPTEWLRIVLLCFAHAVVPVAASIVLMELIRLRRKPVTISTTMWVASLIIFAAIVAHESILLWRIMSRTPGIPMTYWLFRGRIAIYNMLPVAWGMLVAIFALRGLPTARRAAAMLIMVVAPLLVVSAAESLYLATNPRNWFYTSQKRQWTIMPFCTGALLVLALCGITAWRRKFGAPARRWLFALGAGSWLAASLWLAWHSGYFSPVWQWLTDGSSVYWPNLISSAHVLRATADHVVLWMIAPVMLLLVATQVEKTPAREMDHG